MSSTVWETSKLGHVDPQPGSSPQLGQVFTNSHPNSRKSFEVYLQMSHSSVSHSMDRITAFCFCVSSTSRPFSSDMNGGLKCG